jgi:hypothetical protein
MLLLLFHPLGEKTQILHGACDLALCGVELVLIHQWRCSRQAPVGAVGDLNDHRQIAQQFIGQRRCLGFDLLLCFEKQLRILQNALPYLWRGIAPGGIEFVGLPSCEPVPPKRIRHPLAILDVGARHWHQIFHRDMSGDLAGTHALLHAFGKLFHQRQSS